VLIIRHYLLYALIPPGGEGQAISVIKEDKAGCLSKTANGKPGHDSRFLTPFIPLTASVC